MNQHEELREQLRVYAAVARDKKPTDPGPWESITDLLTRTADYLRDRIGNMDARVERACEAAYLLILSENEGPPPAGQETWLQMTGSADPEDIKAMKMMRDMARTMLEAAE